LTHLRSFDRVSVDAPWTRSHTEGYYLDSTRRRAHTPDLRSDCFGALNEVAERVCGRPAWCADGVVDLVFSCATTRRARFPVRLMVKPSRRPKHADLPGILRRRPESVDICSSWLGSRVGGQRVQPSLSDAGRGAGIDDSFAGLSCTSSATRARCCGAQPWSPALARTTRGQSTSGQLADDTRQSCRSTSDPSPVRTSTAAPQADRPPPTLTNRTYIRLTSVSCVKYLAGPRAWAVWEGLTMSRTGETGPFSLCAGEDQIYNTSAHTSWATHTTLGHSSSARSSQTQIRR